MKREEKINHIAHLFHQIDTNILTKQTLVFADTGLTPQQLHLLSYLEHGPKKNSEIGQYLSLSKGTISGLLKRLSEKNLIDRQENIEDRREIFFTLTDEGKAILEEFPEILININDMLFTNATDADLSIWIRQLKRLQSMI